MFEDDDAAPRAVAVLGEDLYGFSVEELRDRLMALDAEKERVQAELDTKQAGLSAADAVFGR